jgi:hypothetical protein
VNSSRESHSLWGLAQEIQGRAQHVATVSEFKITTGLLVFNASNMRTLQSNVTGRSSGDNDRHFRKAMQGG